ncbi:MAG TPA: serine protease, partial [Aquella sp.]|nr:serine protease [Aquella sp.]
NNIDPIEGIYKSHQADGTYYKIAIKKYNEIYKAIVIESNLKSWKQGEIKGYFEQSSANGFYSVKWLMADKTTYETFASMENPALLSIEFKDIETGGKRIDKFIKMFPSAGNDIANNSHETKVSGSGFVVSTDGIIATNAHVINNAKIIYISISSENGPNKYLAKVILKDSKNDVALLQITDSSFKKFISIPYSILEKADIGEKVFTIGYPLNDIMGTNYKVTDGIISSKTGISDDVRYFQITVPLQPGNSGGPLFNSQGNIIGLTTARLNGEAVGTQVENVNYAIKSSYLLNLYNMLPNSYPINSNSDLSGKELKDQIKVLKNYVCLIEAQ